MFIKTRCRLTKRECLSLLESCKSMVILKRIHCQIFRSCLHKSRDVTDDLLTLCTNPETGNLRYAEKVFFSIEEPSIFLYNLMIKALTRSGSPKDAVVLYERMRSDGVLPDNYTYPYVFKAVGILGASIEGRKAHGFIVRSGLEFDLFVRNSLMEMYAQMGEAIISQMLFDEMPEKDIVSWNVLIGGYVKCQMFGEALSVFRKLKEKGLMPDEATMVSTFSACASLGNLELGKKIHYHVKEKLKFTVILCNALLDMYCKCGDVNAARIFFDQMPEKNVISWTTMVSGYASCGQLVEARELFEKSPTKDVVLWTSMLNGLCPPRGLGTREVDT